MLDITQIKRIEGSRERLKNLSIYQTSPIEHCSYYKTREFSTPEKLPLSEFEPCDVGFSWTRNRERTMTDRVEASADLTEPGRLPSSLAVGENVWFRLQFSIPESMAGRPVYLNFVVDPIGSGREGGEEPRLECLCYRDGEPWQAFDDGHEDLLLTEDATGGEPFDLLIEAGTTTLWGLLNIEEFVLDTMQLYATRERVMELSRNFAVLDDLRMTIDDESPNWGKITHALVEASHVFAFDAKDESEYRSTADDAQSILADLKSNLTSDLTGYEITAVGHAHIDLAWIWPWSETVRKSARSFSNVLKLMEEYPDFTFLQSQPHIYEFLRERYPEVYERVTRQIDDGAWHPTGALWVESDINVAGGEALARQYLLGKRYFREEFNIDPKISFIPDVFGYSASLPEIARAADCPYFFTQKLSWNEVNDIPYTSFEWEGIGGSSILTHFPPAETYGGDMSVGEIRDSVTNHTENHVVDDSAYLFGWGDGGGGPTREMIENREIINEISSLPDISFGSLQKFFDSLSESADELPTWVGELYLEKHRGTLTSQAQTKRNNRKGEFALREAELWSSIALASDADFEYAHDRIAHAWKKLLFNQFHDILPGSSVPEVYADADRDYSQVFQTTEAVTADAKDTLFGTTEASNLVCVTNSLSWERNVTVEFDAAKLDADAGKTLSAVTVDGEVHPVQSCGDGGANFLLRACVPPLGATTLELRSTDSNNTCKTLDVSDSHLENNRIRVEFHDDGAISAYDKEAERQLFDGAGNRLVTYRDHPREYDAWDIDGDVYAVGDDVHGPSTVEVVESGPIRATVRQIREFGDSTLIQDVSIEVDSKRIDFRTEVDWHEDETLLKAHFPMAVHATTATYDIQFGHLERDTHDNTSWDEARFEEPHQQWVDVGEHDYGIAVLNDCKYGVHVDGSDVSLSLLRAPNYPDPGADRGQHEFRYSIYPHEGDLREGGVVEAGYEVNTPVDSVPVPEKVERSLLSLDEDGVIVEAVKRAEDRDDALVVRLYEAYGREANATVEFGIPVSGAAETNLIEDHESDLEMCGDGKCDLSFEAFEIKTVLVELD